MQTQSSESVFFVDVRDGTIEQHLANGELRTFPPSTGKSISPLVAETWRANAEHKAILGKTRLGMSAFHPRVPEHARPTEKCSRLLVSLLQRH